MGVQYGQNKVCRLAMGDAGVSGKGAYNQGVMGSGCHAQGLTFCSARDGSHAQNRSLGDHVLAGKANRTSLKMGMESVRVTVSNQSIDQILVDGHVC